MDQEGTRTTPGDNVTAARFSRGTLFITRGANDRIDPRDIIEALARHARGDWGDVGVGDLEENELSLREGRRLFSAYHDRSGTLFWIITEADRSATTVLLPEDY